MPSHPDDPRARAAELRRQADQIEAEMASRETLVATIRSLVSRLAAIQADAATVGVEEIRRQLVGFLEEASRVVSIEGLPLPADNATIATMSATPITEGHVFRGRPIESTHPMPARARELKKSAQRVAAELSKRFRRPIPRQTVQSWYSDSDEARRPIPRDVAMYLAKPPWSIPIDAWQNIRD